MDIQMPTKFFMWCTILDVGILILATIFFMFAPDFVYRTQTRWFPIPRETFNMIFYSFLGLFKIFFIVFNVIPYAALLILGS